MVVNSHLVVKYPPPNQEGPVLGPVSESRLGRIMDAAHLAKVQTLKTHQQQHDYLAGPEEQIRQILLEILNHEPRHKKGDYELRTATFECLYGERGSIDPIVMVGEMSLLPTILEPINDSVELHELREKEIGNRKCSPRVLTNFSGGKHGMYVQENGDPFDGETLSDHEKLAVVDPKKLVKEQFAKNVAELEEARKFQRSAATWRNHCVNHEFTRMCDQEAREKAVEHLIKTLPSEHLRALVNDSIRRGLIETVSDWMVVEDDISFVRQHDINLVSNYARRKSSQSE
jgi:hypothetical protein